MTLGRDDAIRRASLDAGFTVGGENLAIDLVDTIKLAVDPARDLFEPEGRHPEFWRLHAPQLPPGAADAPPDLPATLLLRSAARAVFTATLDGAPPPAADVAVINETARLATPVPQLGSDGVTWQPSGDGDLALGAVALSVIETVANHAHEMRRCARVGCSMLFLSAGVKRVWCSDSCGNRVRVARHAALARR